MPSRRHFLSTGYLAAASLWSSRALGVTEVDPKNWALA
jgi:hypothetical protein